MILLKALREELKVQENKKESEIGKAKIALTTADLELEKYFHPKGEYQKLVDTSKSGIAKAERELEIAKEELKNFQIVVNRGFETLASSAADSSLACCIFRVKFSRMYKSFFAPRPARRTGFRSRY